MKLDIQVYSLLFSFSFGIILNFLLDMFNKFNNKNKIVLKIILSFVFVMLLSIAYFIGLLYINNGYLHTYFFVMIMVGYLFVYLIKSFWFTHKKENSKL